MNADLEMLKADKEAFDSKVEKIKLIEAVIKEGTRLPHSTATYLK